MTALAFHTGHYSIAHPARLDITRAGCDRARRVGKPTPGAFLAPSPDLLRWGLDARQRARGDAAKMAEVWARYEADYLAEVEERIQADPAPLHALLRLPEILCVCYCAGEDAAAERCHRFVAARRVLVPRGAVYRGEWVRPAPPAKSVAQMDLFGGGR